MGLSFTKPPDIFRQAGVTVWSVEVVRFLHSHSLKIPHFVPSALHQHFDTSFPHLCRCDCFLLVLFPDPMSLPAPFALECYPDATCIYARPKALVNDLAVNVFNCSGCPLFSNPSFVYTLSSGANVGSLVEPSYRSFTACCFARTCSAVLGRRRPKRVRIGSLNISSAGETPVVSQGVDLYVNRN